jgi:hypothetical protein
MKNILFILVVAMVIKFEKLLVAMENNPIFVIFLFPHAVSYI